MATKFGEAFVELRADFGKLRAELSTALNTVRDSATKMSASFSTAFKSLAAAGAVVGTLRAMSAAVDAFEKKAIAGEEFAATMTLLGRNAAIATDSAKHLGAEIERVYKIDAEDFLAGLTDIARISGKSGDELERLGRAAVGLTAFGFDISTASVAIAKAVEGNTMSLRRAGIYVNEAASAQEQLNEVLAKSALGLKILREQMDAASETGSRARKQMRIDIENMIEDMGEALLPFAAWSSRQISKILTGRDQDRENYWAKQVATLSMDPGGRAAQEDRLSAQISERAAAEERIAGTKAEQARIAKEIEERTKKQIEATRKLAAEEMKRLNTMLQTKAAGIEAGRRGDELLSRTAPDAIAAMNAEIQRQLGNEPLAATKEADIQATGNIRSALDDQVAGLEAIQKQQKAGLLTTMQTAQAIDAVNAATRTRINLAGVLLKATKERIAEEEAARRDEENKSLAGQALDNIDAMRRRFADILTPERMFGTGAIGGAAAGFGSIRARRFELPGSSPLEEMKRLAKENKQQNDRIIELLKQFAVVN